MGRWRRTAALARAVKGHRFNKRSCHLQEQGAAVGELMGSSFKDLLTIAEKVDDARAGLRSLTEVIDTKSPTGRMIFQIRRNALSQARPPQQDQLRLIG